MDRPTAKVQYFQPIAIYFAVVGVLSYYPSAASYLQSFSRIGGHVGTESGTESNVKQISEAAALLVEHFRKIVDKNYEAAYADLSPEWQSKQSFAKFASDVGKGNWHLCNRPENCVLNDKVSGNHAEVDLDMSGFATEETTVVHFYLARIGGAWKITKGKKAR